MSIANKRNELAQYRQDVMNYAVVLCKDIHNAEDLTQDVMLRAMRYAESYKSGTRPKAWLYHITYNVFIDSTRKKQVNATLELKDTAHLSAIKCIDTSLSQEVVSAIEHLSAEQRVILFLIADGFKYDEIAKIMHIAIGTLRSKLFHIRKFLSKKLKTYAEKSGYK